MNPQEWLEFDEYEPIPTGVGTVAVSKYLPARYKLPIRFYGTEFEFGNLILRVPEEDQDPDSGTICSTCYELDLLMHPTRGVLSVGTVYTGPDVVAVARWDDVHHNLTFTCDILRTELREHSARNEPHAFWSERDLPFGPAIIETGDGPACGPRPADIDDAIIVDGDWDKLPDRLADVMDHHATDCTDLDAYLARNLSTALKTMDYDYIDHIDSFVSREVVYPQLFDTDDAEAA